MVGVGVLLLLFFAAGGTSTAATASHATGGWLRTAVAAVR